VQSFARGDLFLTRAVFTGLVFIERGCMFEQDLLSGKQVHLAEIDPDVDAVVEAAWTNDPCYRLLMEYDKPRGYTASELKKYYETHLKDSDEHRREFYFGIKANTDNRLAGVLAIPQVEWSNRVLHFHIGFGDVCDCKTGSRSPQPCAGLYVQRAKHVSGGYQSAQFCHAMD
jgi:hypothetical protein